MSNRKRMEQERQQLESIQDQQTQPDNPIPNQTFQEAPSQQVDPIAIENTPIPQIQTDNLVEQMEGNSDPEGPVEGDDDGENDSEGKENGMDVQEENVRICPPLLTDFSKHVAADILRAVERPILKCHNHFNLLLEWSPHETYSNHPTWQPLRASGLLRIKDVSYQCLDKSLISSFVERWHPETNSFHMPFEKMTITLDDVHCLTGLRIVGRPVLSSYSSKTYGQEDLQRLLGLTSDEAKAATQGARGSSVRLDWLKNKFSPLVEAVDDDRVLFVARAYTLYVFGCSLFSDKSGTRISTAWLEHVENMQNLNEFTWGTATLAHLYRQLGDASKGKCRQMAGYLTLLQAWIYVHFPSLLRPPLSPRYTNDDPLAMRWSPTHAAPTQMHIVRFRETLDDMTETDVKWEPYASIRDRFQLHSVTFYDGYISINAVVEPYMQDRVLRQYEYIQRVPEMPYVHKIERSGKSGPEIKRAWDALARQFKRADSHSLSADRLGQRAFPAWQCSSDYMEWFTNNSHVRVQPLVHRQTPVRGHNPLDNIARACALMDSCLQRWRSGDNLGTWDEACAVMAAAREALHVDDRVP